MGIINEKLRENYSQLTPLERKLADFILDNQNDAAILNSAELANLCGISKATVSRLFKRLGFSSFKEVKIELRRQRQLGAPVIDGALPILSYASHFEQELSNLHTLSGFMSEDLLQPITKAISNAKSIKVIGFRNSYPVALHLRQQLIQIRSSVSLAPLPGQTLAEEIEGLTNDDLVIIFAFRRRPKLFNSVFKLLLEKNIPICLVADDTLRKISHQANWWIECPLQSASGFDSYSAAMSLTTLLCNSVSHHFSARGQNRILSISDNYRILDELEFS